MDPVSPTAHFCLSSWTRPNLERSAVGAGGGALAAHALKVRQVLVVRHLQQVGAAAGAALRAALPAAAAAPAAARTFGAAAPVHRFDVFVPSTEAEVKCMEDVSLAHCRVGPDLY